MENVQALAVELKRVGEEIKNKYSDESSSDHVCMYCWQPQESNYCPTCEATTDLENDSFLSMTGQEVEYYAAVGD
jgi:hypothetical protein